MIPAEAVEAGLAAWADRKAVWPRDVVRHILEAAAPYIIAGYFREINSKAIAHELENPLNFSKDAP